jgi:hypothetical protein
LESQTTANANTPTAALWGTVLKSSCNSLLYQHLYRNKRTVAPKVEGSRATSHYLFSKDFKMILKVVGVETLKTTEGIFN